ncbi:RNA-binding protein 46-like [Homarus americanus]|uniref:RNA-binding protein 46-like n=1 Tax=Homarus americanus TaxID=6706 RepID=A0A8J5JE91_HOMAM|nr:RNA-binding protein 46-like [Homarus americanus]
MFGANLIFADVYAPPKEVDMVRVLYMRNLSLTTTEEDIRNLCNSSNGVERVKKQKDYAFVHFATREQAEVVKASLNGRVVHGCELEITWAKPVKNREEYHQRKSLARSMISAGQNQTGYVSHVTPGGRSLLCHKYAGQLVLRDFSTTQLEDSLHGSELQRLSLWGSLLLQCLRHRNRNLKAHTRRRGTLQTNSGITTVNSRLLQANQALRGVPLAPQYFMASPMNMPPLITPAMTTASPQSMTVSPGTYLVPSAPLTGYESLNPYALQAAFYQQALMAQPGIAAMDRLRYSTTGE